MALVEVIDQLQRKNNPNLPVVTQARVVGGTGLIRADNAARDAIPAESREVGMEVKVLSPAAKFKLEANLTTWTEIIDTGFIPTSEKGAANGVAPLDANGFVPSIHIQNIFLNNSYVVADEAEMLALTTLTGDFAIREDDGNVYVKLNNSGPPSVIGDWAVLNSPGVSSVNGQTGAVSIDFTALLAFGASDAQFQAAVTGSDFAGVTNSAISTLQGRATSLETDQHNHSNKNLLDSLITSGDGLSYLGDNGDYVLLHTHTNKAAIDKVDDGGDGTLFLASDGVYKAIPGGVGEAPVDGATYGRKNAGWTNLADTYAPVSGGSGYWLTAGVSTLGGDFDLEGLGTYSVSLGRQAGLNELTNFSVFAKGVPAEALLRVYDNNSFDNDSSLTVAPTVITLMSTKSGGQQGTLILEDTGASFFGDEFVVEGFTNGHPYITINELNSPRNIELFSSSDSFGASVKAEGALRIGDITTIPVGTLTSGGLMYVSGTSLFFHGDDGVSHNLLLGLSPGGAEGNIQFNESSNFGANSTFNWDDSNNTFSAGPSMSHTEDPDFSQIMGEDISTIGIGSGKIRWSLITGDIMVFDNAGTARNMNNMFASGTGHTFRIANGSIGIFASSVYGSGNLIEPGFSGSDYQGTLLGGISNISRNGQQQISGQNVDALGMGAFVHGLGDATKKLMATGDYSVNFSSNTAAQTSGHGANANNSFIFGGIDHNIPATSDRSVIMGGSLIKAPAGIVDTVFMPKVRIGLGTGGALPTVGETHMLAYDNATGEIIRAALPGGGGGDVTKVGTPVNNQLAIWTGDGTVKGSSDADENVIVGRTRIDSRVTDVAHFSHFDQSGNTSYALSQLSDGETHLNAASGKQLLLSIDNGIHVTIAVGKVAISNSVNLEFGTSSGSKIGASTNQKFAFWNATPIVQPTHIADATDAASAITQLNALLAQFALLGLQASS